MGSPSPLILVPTLTERNVICDAFSAAGHGNLEAELCGFGPITAAARTVDLLAQQKPPWVLLIGIAGGFSGEDTCGGAYQFSNVVCHGVGVGTGAGFLPAAEIGFRQTEFLGSSSNNLPTDEIPLLTTPDQKRTNRVLLTACAASADKKDRILRQQLYRDIFAEDMEGFGVALACQQQKIPCMIIRGISNEVGDRDKTNWKIDVALKAAAALALTSLADT